MRRLPAVFAVSASLLAALLWPVVESRALASPGWLVVKLLAVAPLAALAFAAGGRVVGARTLALALALHAAGDLLLERRFLAGLVAFLLGHLAYIALLWPRRRSLDELGGGLRVALGSVALVASLVLAVLVPRLGAGLAVAVPLYVAVLVAMAGSALLARPAQPWLAVGATLFVTSDALLALERFVGIASAGAPVWPSYVLAQLFLSIGWLARGPRTEPGSG